MGNLNKWVEVIGTASLKLSRSKGVASTVVTGVTRAPLTKPSTGITGIK
jgi:hypothetical protein